MFAQSKKFLKKISKNTFLHNNERYSNKFF